MTVLQAIVVTALGFVTLIVGLIGLLRPYPIALWRERLDALEINRSKTEIEPTMLRVRSTQLMFFSLILGGIIFLVIAFEEWQRVL